MSSKQLASSSLEKLKCCRCNCPLSVPPVTFTNSDGFLCGRCSSNNTETSGKNVPYEVLAKHYHFPCRYESFGCKQRHTLKSMKTHEKYCEKKPFLCPLLPKGACLWRGNEIAKHLQEKHAQCFMDTKTVQLDLQKAPSTFNKAFIDDGTCFLIRFLYNKTKGITINLLEVPGKNSEYGIEIHSFDCKRTVKVSACKMSHLNAETDGCFIDINTLNFLSADTKKLLLKVMTFVEESTKVDSKILNLLECPVCTEFMSGAIYQCKTGHSFCENCKRKLAQCPLCKNALTNMLNYALMELSAQSYLPCKNRQIGCNFEGFFKQTAQHESVCQRFECPLKIPNTCAFSGEKHDLLDHCLRKHDYLTQENRNVMCNLKAKNCTITKIICAHNNVFRSCRKFTGNELFWSIQFYGSKEEAETFNFSIEFERDGKKLVFSDVCAKVAHQTRIFENALCIPWFQLQRFVSSNFCVNNNIFVTQNV